MMCTNGCIIPSIKERSAVCQIYFDRGDIALTQLNAHNARAVLSFEAMCGREKLP